MWVKRWILEFLWVPARATLWHFPAGELCHVAHPVPAVRRQAQRTLPAHKALHHPQLQQLTDRHKLRIVAVHWVWQERLFPENPKCCHFGRLLKGSVLICSNLGKSRKARMYFYTFTKIISPKIKTKSCYALYTMHVTYAHNIYSIWYHITRISDYDRFYYINMLFIAFCTLHIVFYNLLLYSCCFISMLHAQWLIYSLKILLITYLPSK